MHIFNMLATSVQFQSHCLKIVEGVGYPNNLSVMVGQTDEQNITPHSHCNGGRQIKILGLFMYG